jgi:hypothetical protein
MVNFQKIESTLKICTISPLSHRADECLYTVTGHVARILAVDGKRILDAIQ